MTRTPVSRSKGQRSTCRVGGLLWRPPAQLVIIGKLFEYQLHWPNYNYNYTQLEFRKDTAIMLLSVCEKELQWLDMSINAKKSACLRIGPRYNAKCKCIMTSNGGEISFYLRIRYDILECTFVQPTSSRAQFVMPRNRFIAHLIVSLVK